MPIRACRGALFTLLLVTALAAAPARAWSGHALCSWPALSVMPELTGVQVEAEPLERYLAAQAPQLEALLAEHEAWARQQLPTYAPRPDSLAFKAAPDGDRRSRFLRALRLNVSARLPLFLEARPGQALVQPELPWSEVTTLASGRGARDNRFVALADGDKVSVVDVLATASAEPDYGLDLNLFADNGSEQGQAYGFGKQPFGNSALDYATQAPFHMGFHHEARVVFAAAGFLRRTHPEDRTALFLALSRQALASGHAYWGWRFAGWALHYVQDLTQPYHARVLPGVGAARLIATNLAAMAGYERPKNDAITLVSNRHTVVEAFQFKRMVAAFEQGRQDDLLLAALRDTRDDAAQGAFVLPQLRERVSREAFDAADALDAQLERSFSPRYTADPGVTLGNQITSIDLPRLAREQSAAEHDRLEQLVAARLQRLGLYTRSLVRALQPAVEPKSTRAPG